MSGKPLGQRAGRSAGFTAKALSVRIAASPPAPGSKSRASSRGLAALWGPIPAFPSSLFVSSPSASRAFFVPGKPARRARRGRRRERLHVERDEQARPPVETAPRECAGCGRARAYFTWPQRYKQMLLPASRYLPRAVSNWQPDARPPPVETPGTRIPTWACEVHRVRVPLRTSA